MIVYLRGKDRFGATYPFNQRPLRRAYRSFIRAHLERVLWVEGGHRWAPRGMSQEGGFLPFPFRLPNGSNAQGAVVAGGQGERVKTTRNQASRLNPSTLNIESPAPLKVVLGFVASRVARRAQSDPDALFTLRNGKSRGPQVLRVLWRGARASVRLRLHKPRD